MRLFAPKSISKGMISIEISPEGIAIAYLTPAPNTALKVCEFHITQNYSQVRTVLGAAVIKNSLAQNDCTLVLHPDHYKLLFINSPNVPETEFRNAARWQIKDMINYSLDDLAIDIFYPRDSQTKLKKIYVIAAQKSLLQKITGIVSECQLTPVVIDIREFALRNIITKIKNAPEVCGALDIADDSCLMLIVQNGHVQFVRRIPIGIRTIKETNSAANLIAEIQRSLHYCEVELRQKAPEKYFLTPSNILETTFFEAISKELAKELQLIDLNGIISAVQPLSPEIQARCWPTIGAVLRQNEQP